MPFTTMSTITPLSNYWTHQAIASEAMVLTNTIDNENIQLDNIRNHIKANISHLAKLLNLASSPWYGIWMSGTLENTLHNTGLEWINLSIGIPPVNGFVPATQVMDIKRINVGMSQGIPANTNWIGNCTKLDVSQLTQLQSYQNLQWRHSIAWAHHGSDLLFFVGSNIGTLNRPAGTDYNISQNQQFIAIAYRRPILDDLLPPSNLGSQYYVNIDLPDEYADLLIKMTVKRILEQLKEQVPQVLDAEINQGLANINGLITAELQFEQSEREKRKYGAQQKGPGGVA